MVCIVYKNSYSGKYRLDWGNQISFKLENVYKNTKALNYAIFNTHLAVYGIIDSNAANKYEIVSGSNKIIDEYEKNTYFIKEYELEDASKGMIRPIADEKKVHDMRKGVQSNEFIC